MRSLSFSIALLFCFLNSKIVFAQLGSNNVPLAIEVAQQLDTQLNQALANEEGVNVASIVNDEDFLRRLSLDLLGVVPSAKDVTLFGLDPSPDKRAQMIDRMLASDEFGKNWGSYWRNVVMSRATEQRARIVLPAFERWFVDQLNENRRWDEITRELLTATGPVGETGETGLIFAHTGQPEELAAEVSRIFMGIQMSCANCHDHPTDSWKREDFHQFAAFLPRISVRREEPGNPRSFAVRSMDNDRRRNRNVDVDQLFVALDRNRDGAISKSESRGPLTERFDQVLSVADADKNGKLSKEEFGQIRQMANNQQPGRGELEYYMPDLNNPASQGTLTQPVFFIPEVQGPDLKESANDMTRRHALADYITSPTNEWFAKAFVNRIWSEMLGQGFYMPIDDIGPERLPMFEDVLNHLAEGFVQSGYDIKWVYRTIANTEAYQRELRARDGSEYVPPFASATATRLRSDQIYESLFKVLGTSSQQAGFRRNRGAGMAFGRGLDPAKLAFQQTFGVDPSTPKDEIIGNVPQALFMMNNRQVEQMIRAEGNTRLARILKDQSDDSDALREVYLLALAREPSERELNINKGYIQEVGQRGEAFEDILWSLLNSTEFLSKR